MVTWELDLIGNSKINKTLTNKVCKPHKLLLYLYSKKERI